jgi:hypothetical protein
MYDLVNGNVFLNLPFATTKITWVSRIHSFNQRVATGVNELQRLFYLPSTTTPTGSDHRANNIFFLANASLLVLQRRITERFS